MSRLSKSIREQMARVLVNHRFADEGKRMGAANRALFERVYDEAYDAKILAHMAALQIVSPHLFEKHNDIRVNVNGMRFDIGGRSPCQRNTLVRIEQARIEPRPMILGYCSSYGDAYVPRDEKLNADLREHILSVPDFSQRIERAYNEAMAALDAFSTGKKLAEGWPEAIPVIGHMIPEGIRTLPTVQVAELNSKFGLPPSAAA